jgi:SAM-dependent methyltransferase
MGLCGDILEIGCYYGRSTCVLAKCLRAGERLVVCDTFDLDTGEKYAEVPTIGVVAQAIRSFVPTVTPAQLDLRRCKSEQLELAPTDRFRFVHVDGAHEQDVALHDIRLAASHLAEGGIIAVDDYMHYEYRGVTLAVDEFLATAPGFRVLYDLNRREEEGRKIYLGREAARPGAGDQNTGNRRGHGS